jgi:hypothetical protein
VEPTPKLIDIGKAQAALERLVLRIEADTSINAATVLSQAQILLARVNDSPSVELEQLDPGGNHQDTLWQAMRVSDESGEQNIICWRARPDAEAVIAGTWKGAVGPRSKLLLLTVQVGDRFWGMRETEHGQSYFSSDGTAEGPGDEKVLADLQQRADERMHERAHGLSFPVDWTCPRCNWPNPAGTVCQMCQTPKAAAANLGLAQGRKRGSQPAHAYSLFERGIEFEGLPPGLDPQARLNSELDLPPGLEDMLEQIARFSGVAVELIFDAKAEQKPHCIRCGVEISTSTRFCSKCGAEQRPAPPPGPEAAPASHPQRQGVTAAPDAGWGCIKCDHGNPRQAKFCMNCAAPAPHSPSSPEKA